MNHVILVGRLGAKPQLGNFGEDGTRGIWARMRLATLSYFKDGEGQRRERTDWHRVTAFGALAGTLEHLKRGDLVAVSGRLRSEPYEKDGKKGWSVDVVASEVVFLKLAEREEEDE